MVTGEMRNPIDFDIVKLYHADIYTGYCTSPIHGYFSDSPEWVRQEWDEAWAIRIKEGEKEDGTPVYIYFLLGGWTESLHVTDVDTVDTDI